MHQNPECVLHDRILYLWIWVDSYIYCISKEL